MNTLNLTIKKNKKHISLFPFERKKEEATANLRCRLHCHLSPPISPSATFVAYYSGTLLELVMMVHGCGL